MISMRPSLQRIIAWGVGVCAALVVIVCIAVLMTNSLEARRLVPVDKERIEALQKLARQDVKHAPEVAAEFDEQTQASLRREARYEAVTGILVVAAVLLLVCGKWLTWLNGPRLPAPVGMARARPGRNGPACLAEASAGGFPARDGFPLPRCLDPRPGGYPGRRPSTRRASTGAFETGPKSLAFRPE